ncbi:MAG: hypothetical protein ABEI98_03165, partial [Halorhabdus sp.]
MTAEPDPEATRRDRIAHVVSVVTAILFAGVVAAGIGANRTTLVLVVAFGFLAMVAGVTISLFVDFSTPERQVW